ncbi:GNAT family N-acetyltransferase [Dactylosporangium sp. CS-047395]|uniref:GNAT family N-acetyltransferase n=1 Tax=Dactylosporangium sp. CS-047395 TaxID=3239936 RepID=UPI003D8D3C6C
MSRWMCEPHVEAFWHAAWPPSRWADELAGQLAGEHSRPYVVAYEGEPLSYLEVYRTPRDVVGRQYDADPYDLGVHLAIGDLAQTGRGLGRAMVRAVAEGLAIADPRCRRVFADPDERHVVARRMFARAGFRSIGIHDLGHKRAELLFLDISA